MVIQMKPLKDYRVLVTPTSFSKYKKELALELENSVGEVIYNDKGRPLDEVDLLPIISGFDGMIAGLEWITGKVISEAKRLKVISRYGTGVDRVDLQAAKRSGIYVTNTPGANSISVAELTIGLAISLARKVCEVNYETKLGQWPRIKGITLHDKVFGIIGFGSVGKEIAVRLKPFNCKVLAYDIDFNSKIAKEINVYFSEINDLLAESDFVSLHVPYVKSTHGMVDNNFLKKMKRGAFLINTARGELIDEKALYDNIKSGQIGGAALDVFCEEPCSKHNPLFSLPGVIATAHIGAATDNASNEMTRISIDECLAVLKGEEPKHAVVIPDQARD